MAPQLPSPGPQPMSDQHRVVLGASVRGASVLIVGTPGASIPSPQPVLPFGPAHSAAQSLGGSGLGHGDRVVSMDTQIACYTSWITVLALDFSGEPPTTTSTHEHVHSLLTGLEGVHMHEGRILVSATTEGAHDALLEGVLTHLQVGDGGSVQAHACLGQGSHTWATPSPALTALHCQNSLHRPCAPLARPHCHPIALLPHIAALLCHTAALRLLGTPVALLVVRHTWRVASSE